MTTRRAVVADDVFGTINDRRWELERRLRKGTLDPKKVAAGLQELIEKSSWPKFPVWRTIRHVGKRNAASYCAGIHTAGYKTSEWVDDLLSRFQVTSVNEEVDLGCASVAKLGFREATRYDVICNRIEKCCGMLCLPEDGPVLREQYRNQPVDERLCVAMKAICGADSSLHVFDVVNDGYNIWLHRICGDPDGLWALHDRFVFRLGKRLLVA